MLLRRRRTRWPRTVLNIGFFLSAGHEKNSETEAAVGQWTGNLVSVFFITQFFTSLLWSSIADRHGRRAVLVASLTGSAIALVVFGTSKSVCFNTRAALILAS